MDNEYNNRKEVWLDSRPLKKVRLKGGRMSGLLINLLGWIDNRRGMVLMDGTKLKSPWLSKRDRYWDSYTADLYKTAGEIVKVCLAEREQVNDKLKVMWRDRENLGRKISSMDHESELVKEKRIIAATKQQIEIMEKDILEQTARLKEIRVSIGEFNHELAQLLQERKMQAESQMISYIRGTGKVSYDDVLLVVNETSKSLYDELESGFEYCMNMDGLWMDEEKEDDHYEYLQ